MNNLSMRSGFETMVIGAASLGLLESAWAASNPLDEAERASRYVFESIGCSEQSRWIELIAQRARSSGLNSKLGLDAFARASENALTPWCARQIPARSAGRPSTLAFCQKEYSRQFRKFLNVLYTQANADAAKLNVFTRHRAVAPSCLLSSSSRKLVQSGRWIESSGASKTATSMPKKQSVALPELPSRTPRTAEAAPGAGTRLVEKAQAVAGYAGEYRGFYANQFRNQKCPAWKKYLDQVLDSETSLKAQATKCGLPNKITLDVISGIAPQGGYKLTGTGVNTAIQLGSARDYQLGKTRTGQVICPHGDKNCLKNNRGAIVLPSYCSGATYTALIGTINVLSPEIFSLMSKKQLDNFTPGLMDDHGLYGLVNNSGDGVRDAAKAMARFGDRYRIAEIIDTNHAVRPFAKLCAGDYMQWDRKQRNEISEADYINGFQANGSGHSGVFLGVEANNEGQSMAYFWSSNGGTRGYGVTCEPVAHMSPKAIRFSNPKPLVHIPEYRAQAGLRGDLMNMHIDERQPMAPNLKSLTLGAARASEI